ncbi:MAG: hypothetical protein ACRD9R_21620, partial [Pyrinomonadaceae bacterium]
AKIEGGVSQFMLRLVKASIYKARIAVSIKSETRPGGLEARQAGVSVVANDERVIPARTGRR